jgi:hypothetical protein
MFGPEALDEHAEKISKIKNVKKILKPFIISSWFRLIKGKFSFYLK